MPLRLLLCFYSCKAAMQKHAFCRCLDGIRQVTKWQICARISVKVGQADAFILFRDIKKMFLRPHGLKNIG